MITTRISPPIAHLSTTRLVAIALLVVGAMSTGPARAQAAPQGAAANDNESSQLEAVVVTGTRRTDRSATDSASPIDIISGADINAQPTANMLDTVRNLVPSFYVGQNTISDASTFVRAPSLRGLPSDQVLVLLNGKRFNRSALVQVYNGGDTGLSFGSHGSDLASIPSIAIKKLEVLRDGATAQYGSDAIAGVLNYGLRDDTGFEVVARYGQYQEDSDGESQQIAANFGFALGDRGFVNLSAEYVDDGETSRGVTRPTAVAFADENPDLADELPHYPLPAQIWGNSPMHGYKLLLNSALDVTENSSLYLFANYADSHADQSFNFRSSLVGTRPFVDEAGNTINLGGREFFQHPYLLTRARRATPPARRAATSWMTISSCFRRSIPAASRRVSSVTPKRSMPRSATRERRVRACATTFRCRAAATRLPCRCTTRSARLTARIRRRASSSAT